LRRILKSRVCMVVAIKADRAIIVGDSIRMVMECKPQNAEGKTYE